MSYSMQLRPDEGLNPDLVASWTHPPSRTSAYCHHGPLNAPLGWLRSLGGCALQRLCFRPTCELPAGKSGHDLNLLRPNRRLFVAHVPWVQPSVPRFPSPFY